MRPASVAWALLFGLWLLLVDRLEGAELAAGAAAALIAAVTGGVACRGSLSPALPRRVDLSAPARVLRDTGLVLGAVVLHLCGIRPMRGRMRRVPADPALAGPSQTTRRAVALFGVSVAPNTVAIGVDTRADRIVVHVLVDRG